MIKVVISLIYKINMRWIPSLKNGTGHQQIKAMCMCALSHLQRFATPWTVAQQALLSMEFSRQEY